MTVGHLILSGQFIILNAESLILPLMLGLLASIVMTGYTALRYHLDEKITKLKAAAQENEHLKRLESEARLTSLQAKLNPHFLFNTLNSLAALVYDDPQKAESGIIKLSEVYRHVLSISQRTFVPIQEEIRLIQDYLDLEKMRFDDQLQFKINFEDQLLHVKIPGLLIEPLIGNVIKHSLSKTDETVRIELSISKNDDRIIINVCDDGPGCETEKIVYGYGLVSVQERLQMVYPDMYTFEIQSSPGQGFEVSLSIPFNTRESESDRGGQ